MIYAKSITNVAEITNKVANVVDEIAKTIK
jgi:hypothetical protein